MAAGPWVPGRKWYVVAVAVAFAGAAAFAAVLFLGLRGLGQDFARFAAPGAMEFEVSEPGRYTIYRESGALGGVYYESSDVPGLEVVVTAPDGSEIPLVAPTVTQSYTVPGRRGHSVFDFFTRQTGRYRMEARYTAGGGPATILAVGRGFSMQLMTLIVASVGMAFLTVTSSLGIAAATFVQRYRAGKRARPSPA